MASSSAVDTSCGKPPQGRDEEIASRYDRQVRLWGNTLQQKLQQTTVCIATLDGVGSEVAKNLCLVGVRRINVLDSERVKADHLPLDHLLHQSDIGHSRGLLATRRLHEMNPFVDVQYVTPLHQENEASTCATSTGNLASFGVLQQCIAADPLVVGNVMFVSNYSVAQIDALLTSSSLLPRNMGGPELVVSLSQFGSLLLGLMLSTSLEASTKTDGADSRNGSSQLASLVSEAAQLGQRPASFQLAVLLMHAAAEAPTTFASTVRRLLQLRSVYSLQQLHQRDIQRAAEILHQGGASEKGSSAIDATIAGGVCVQCVVNLLGGQPKPTSWFVLETNGSGLECLVG